MTVNAKEGTTRVVVLDDDATQVADYIRSLERTGKYVVRHYRTAESMFEEIKDFNPDIAFVDLRLRSGRYTAVQTKQGKETGVMIARDIAMAIPNIKTIILAEYTGSLSLSAFERKSINIVSVREKSKTTTRELLLLCDRVLGTRYFSPNVFIVHGHDGAAVLSIQNMLEELGWGRGTVLKDEASEGRTIIEKFESFAEDADYVIVLLTPDDVATSIKTASDTQARARQNVIFELGYFYGQMRRLSGRVIIVLKNDVELPSDILGIGYVRFSNVDELSSQLAIEFGF